MTKHILVFTAAAALAAGLVLWAGKRRGRNQARLREAQATGRTRG